MGHILRHRYRNPTGEVPRVMRASVTVASGAGSANPDQTNKYEADGGIRLILSG